MHRTPLEALLREPSGCFEQSSTSNYPNVLILNYLKDADLSKPDVEKRARAVFAAEGIPVTGSQVENSGAKREIKGTKGDLEISVSMEQQSAATTKTEVSARKNIAVWDKDYAQQLLGKIVNQK